jgi:penicillin-binding protein 1A
MEFQHGAQYYFSTDISNLSLAQCAFLAGINNSPNSYNPFGEKNNSEKIKNRTTTVLNKMKELNYITEDEYDTAIEEVSAGLNFKKGNISAKNDGIYSYYIDALFSELISDFSNKNHITTTFAENYIEMANLKIYSNQNTDIQNTMEKEFKKTTYILSSSSSDATSQAAMVIIDHTTGYILGCVGGLGEKTSSRGLNRATQAVRQTGSAMKPLAVLAPAIQERVITASSIYNDERSSFVDYNGEDYSPINSSNSYLGNITVRRAVESSQNIPFVKIMEELTPQTSIKYLKKLGISTLTDNDQNLALSLGGLDNGISPLEMAAAYSTLANNGVYIEPTFYTSVEDTNKNIILKSHQKTHRVFSKATAYIVSDLLTQPVNGSHGTATYCKINGIDVSAKTGTTNSNYDRWLCEYTPYYTGVTWYGFDLNETINYSTNPAELISYRIFATIHANLSSKSFEKPFGVTSSTICSETGLVANNSCTGTYTEYFLNGTVPQNCNKHFDTSSSTTTKNNKSNSNTTNNTNSTTTNNTNTTTNNTSNSEINIDNNITNTITNNITTDNSTQNNSNSTPNNNVINSNLDTNTQNANTYDNDNSSKNVTNSNSNNILE